MRREGAQEYMASILIENILIGQAAFLRIEKWELEGLQCELGKRSRN
jgi:hypothetical protein